MIQNTVSRATGSNTGRLRKMQAKSSTRFQAGIGTDSSGFGSGSGDSGAETGANS